MEAPSPKGENSDGVSTRVTFAITGSTVQPEEITKTFHIKPTRAFAAGEVYKSKAGKRVRGFGQWAIESGKLVDSTSTEEHASAILKLFEPQEAAIKKYLHATRDRVAISIWWEGSGAMGGFTLESATIAKLAQFCQEVDFHFCS